MVLYDDFVLVLKSNKTTLLKFAYDTAMWRCHSDSNPRLVVGPGVESPGFMK